MITGLNHLTLSTKDLDTSFRFYCEVLGLKPLLRHSKGAYLLAGEFWLCLDLDANTRLGPLPEYTHSAWTVCKRDFALLSQKIRESGAEVWKQNRSEGDSLYFLDPDGHKLEIHVGSWKSRLAHARENPWGEGMEFFSSSDLRETTIRRASTIVIVPGSEPVTLLRSLLSGGKIEHIIPSNIGKLDQLLVDSAIQFVKERFPSEKFAGAAAVYTEDGDILISTAPAAVNEAVSLCHETGAICEAYTKNKRVTASVCVSRDDNDEFIILSPCGVCQERLWFWGESVEVAVPLGQNFSEWKAITLKELAPHYWRIPFMRAESPTS